jgi:hypothetical protein
MKKPEFTTENCEKLATDIVDVWDMDDLIGFAVDTLVDQFKNCGLNNFLNEWNAFYVPKDEPEGR